MIGVLSAALLSSMSLPMPDELPAYPGTVLTRIGERLIVDGMPQQLAYFVARDPLEAVARYFLRKWGEKGYLTTADGDFPQGIVVSAFCTREAIQKAVVLRAQGRMTIGFSVLRSLRGISTPLNVPPSVEGHLFVHDSRLENAAGKGSHRTLLLNVGLAQARQKVIEQLRTTGCRVVDEGALSIESKCPVGRIRTLLVAQSPDLTAVLETSVEETGNEHHRERGW
jgi:hypothetical protein